MATEVQHPNLIKQYNEIKRRHPHALLVFRIDQRYESFMNDAVQVSQILNLTITNRLCDGKFFQVTGFNASELDSYLPKLVKAGNRVAVCDQLYDPDQLANKPRPVRLALQSELGLQPSGQGDQLSLF